MGRSNLSREANSSGANGDGEQFVFPYIADQKKDCQQARLICEDHAYIHTLCEDHAYIHTYFNTTHITESLRVWKIHPLPTSLLDKLGGL